MGMGCSPLQHGAVRVDIGVPLSVSLHGMDAHVACFYLPDVLSR